MIGAHPEHVGTIVVVIRVRSDLKAVPEYSHESNCLQAFYARNDIDPLAVHSAEYTVVSDKDF